MAKAKAKKLEQQETAAVPATPPPKKERRQGKNPERRAQLSRELAMELDALRVALTEMIDRYRLKVDADLLQLSTAATGETPFDAKPHKLPIAVTQKMLKLVREVEIKPKKGRGKDFQRLQDLVADLIAELPPAK